MLNTVPFFNNCSAFNIFSTLIANLFVAYSLLLSQVLFINFFVSGVVSKQTGEIPQTREATTEGFGPQRVTRLQRRHDAEHLSGGGALLSTLSPPHRHQQIPSGQRLFVFPSLRVVTTHSKTLRKTCKRKLLRDSRMRYFLLAYGSLETQSVNIAICFFEQLRRKQIYRVATFFFIDELFLKLTFLYGAII